MIPKPGKFLPLLAALLLTATSCLAQSAMTHHVRDVVRNGKAQATGRLPNNQVLQLDLVLSLRDPAGLKSFLADVYSPSSANFRQFLAPAEFTARFGPTAEQYEAVVRFANTYGLEVVGGSRDAMEVQVKGTVANIEAAFHVNMRTYQHPTENRTFYSPDREPTMDLPFKLWHISGLDNYSIPKPLHVRRDEYAAAHGIYPDQVVSHATTGSGPSASFLGSDMRAAYYGGTALTGAGQHLGLLEFAGTDLADLNTYYANVHQTNNVPVNLISTDGSSTSCVYTPAGGFCDDTEQTLDMTQALGMAPGLASLDVYVSTVSDVAIISAMTTHNPLPTTIGCSWGWTPVDPSTLDPYFQKMGAQGQNFFAASGDSSTWSKSVVAWPADDDYVVSVGGTDLTTSSAAGPWASETAWVDSGGGISPDGIAIPSWQQLSGVINSSNKGSTTLRNGPDVSANANFTFYVCADQSGCTANNYGGTSFAAPMWAAFIALANQQYGSANPGKTLGFLNPAIYQQNITSSYSTNFHDITSGTSGSYSAVTGYDLVTGWGSPTAALITALTGGTSTTGSFTLSSSGNVSIQQGNSGQVTISDSVSGTLSSVISLSVSGLPSNTTSSFNPTTLPSSGNASSTLTINTTSSTPAGTYTITVTGMTSDGSTQTTSFTLTVTSASGGNFSITAGSPITVTRGGSTGDTVTITAVSGFSGSVSLSASGAKRGVSINFSPPSVTGSSNSTMTVKANKNALTGTYNLTVTGTSGSLVHSATVSLTVK